MSNSRGRGYQQHNHSHTELVGVNRKAFSSAPLSKKGGKTARFNIPGESSSTSSVISNDDNGEIVEVTLDVRDDYVALHSIKTTEGADVEDPEFTLLGEGIKKKSSFSGSLLKNGSERLKKLTSFSKRPDVGRIDRTTPGAVHALAGLNFISKTNLEDGWEAVEKRFDDLTSKTNGLLTRAQFGECIGTEKSNDFDSKLFDTLARRRNIKGGLVNKAQLREFWDETADQSFDSRLQTFFDMVDKDADGRITVEEITEIISLSASDNKLSTIREKAEEYAALIMEELDPDNLGYIMIESLEMLLLQAPTHSVRVGESKIVSQMISQDLKAMKKAGPLRRWYVDFKYSLIVNWKRIWVMALWIGIMAGLFTFKYIQNKNRAAFEVMGHCVCMAKGAAETLKLNMALILLPVCRNTITWLRNKTKLGMAVPFDDNLSFHKLIAIAIAIGVGIHGISHLACDFPRLLHATPDEYEPMEEYFGDQPTSYWWFVKGVEGLTGMIMVVLMAIAFTLALPRFRSKKKEKPKPDDKIIGSNVEGTPKPKHDDKTSGFNVFWYSHHLFVIVYSLLIVHGIKLYLTKEWYNKTTWMYIAVPLMLYAGERLLRAFRSSIKKVEILKVALFQGHKGDVLTLHMSKPLGFKYKSGQYMFVNCPAVSPFEWHPFSITSAPGNDYLSVHIRIVGDWTKELKTVFSEILPPLASDKKSGVRRAEFLQGENNGCPRVMIDGPYGAPAQDYTKYDVVLLVGQGIGVTPMISIVKDIVNKMKAIREEEENSNIALEDGVNPAPQNVDAKQKSSRSVPNANNFKTRKVYFYWVTGEQGSFDWFDGIMNEVAEIDEQGVIELHSHCTSVYEEGDARSALITMLQSLYHAKNGLDVVSGTKVKAHFARPKWRNVFKGIAVRHQNEKVGVFYCGLPEMEKDLEECVLEFSRLPNTTFEFNKENF